MDPNQNSTAACIALLAAASGAGARAIQADFSLAIDEQLGALIGQMSAEHERELIQEELPAGVNASWGSGGRL